jgi:hypothetical protein
MSEYQYVAFRAIDAPVREENLAYMERQSSRAEITPWSFDNEYHYGDFGGDAAGMLRRGYDLHVHYANYGTRTLMIRLPDGLPDPEASKPYFTAACRMAIPAAQGDQGRVARSIDGGPPLNSPQGHSLGVPEGQSRSFLADGSPGSDGRGPATTCR